MTIIDSIEDCGCQWPFEYWNVLNPWRKAVIACGLVSVGRFRWQADCESTTRGCDQPTLSVVGLRCAQARCSTFSRGDWSITSTSRKPWMATAQFTGCNTHWDPKLGRCSTLLQSRCLGLQSRLSWVKQTRDFSAFCFCSIFGATISQVHCAAPTCPWQPCSPHRILEWKKSKHVYKSVKSGRLPINSCLDVRVFRPNRSEQKQGGGRSLWWKLALPSWCVQHHWQGGAGHSEPPSQFEWQGCGHITDEASLPKKDGALWSVRGSTHALMKARVASLMINVIWERERIGLSSTFILCIVV